MFLAGNLGGVVVLSPASPEPSSLLSLGAQRLCAPCPHSGSWPAAGCFLYKAERTRNRCWGWFLSWSLALPAHEPTATRFSAAQLQLTCGGKEPLWVQLPPPGESLQGLQRRGERCGVRVRYRCCPPSSNLGTAWALASPVWHGFLIWKRWEGCLLQGSQEERCRWRADAGQVP